MRVVTGDRKKIKQGKWMECPSREGCHKGVLAKAVGVGRSKGGGKAQGSDSSRGIKVSCGKKGRGPGPECAGRLHPASPLPRPASSPNTGDVSHACRQRRKEVSGHLEGRG